MNGSWIVGRMIGDIIAAELSANVFVLAGYQKLKEFIVTQHPLESTVSDFWQMVWDHNSQTVVVLSDAADEEYQIFWPLKQADVEFENFRVRFIEERQVPLPGLNPATSHVLKEEFVTQIEVAAQSLQVINFSRSRCSNFR